MNSVCCLVLEERWWLWLLKCCYLLLENRRWRWRRLVRWKLLKKVIISQSNNVPLCEYILSVNNYFRFEWKLLIIVSYIHDDAIRNKSIIYDGSLCMMLLLLPYSMSVSGVLCGSGCTHDAELWFISEWNKSINLMQFQCMLWNHSITYFLLLQPSTLCRPTRDRHHCWNLEFGKFGLKVS